MATKKPSESGFTIYTKSGCINCSKVKRMLEDNCIKYEIIDCDDYIIEDKESFLFFMKTLTNVEIKTFPLVFNNGVFIGSYIETKNYIEKVNCFDTNLDF